MAWSGLRTCSAAASCSSALRNLHRTVTATPKLLARALLAEYGPGGAATQLYGGPTGQPHAGHGVRSDEAITSTIQELLLLSAPAGPASVAFAEAVASSSSSAAAAAAAADDASGGGQLSTAAAAAPVADRPSDTAPCAEPYGSRTLSSQPGTLAWTHSVATVAAAAAAVGLGARLLDGALVGAAAAGRQQVVRMLLVSGADRDACEPYGRCALFEAARNGHVEVVRLLLEAGARVDGADGQEPPPYDKPPPPPLPLPLPPPRALPSSLPAFNLFPPHQPQQHQQDSDDDDDGWGAWPANVGGGGGGSVGVDSWTAGGLPRVLAPPPLLQPMDSDIAAALAAVAAAARPGGLEAQLPVGASSPAIGSVAPKDAGEGASGALRKRRRSSDLGEGRQSSGDLVAVGGGGAAAAAAHGDEFEMPGGAGGGAELLPHLPATRRYCDIAFRWPPQLPPPLQRRTRPLPRMLPPLPLPLLPPLAAAATPPLLLPSPSLLLWPSRGRRATPLLAACKSGHAATAALLLRHDARVDLECGSELVLAGHPDVVDELLAAVPGLAVHLGAALVGAAGGNRAAVVSALLRHGADPTCSGGMALNEAAYQGHRHVLELLLAAGGERLRGGGAVAAALSLARRWGRGEAAALLADAM